MENKNLMLCLCYEIFSRAVFVPGTYSQKVQDGIGIFVQKLVRLVCSQFLK